MLLRHRMSFHLLLFPLCVPCCDVIPMSSLVAASLQLKLEEPLLVSMFDALASLASPCLLLDSLPTCQPDHAMQTVSIAAGSRSSTSSFLVCYFALQLPLLCNMPHNFAQASKHIWVNLDQADKLDSFSLILQHGYGKLGRQSLKCSQLPSQASTLEVSGCTCENVAAVLERRMDRTVVR